MSSSKSLAKQLTVMLLAYIFVTNGISLAAHAANTSEKLKSQPKTAGATPARTSQMKANPQSAPLASMTQPNGKIVFNGARNGVSGIYTMEEDGSNPTLVASSNGASGAVWSPDGTKFVYTDSVTLGPGSFALHVFVMNADGTNRTDLTTGLNDAREGRWSPDGSKIVYVASLQNGLFDIFVMNADGTNKTRLTDGPAFNMTPAWSPDGSKLAFASNRDGAYQIYLMNADGSGETRITNNAANDSAPAWSPDSTRIAFTTDRDQATGSEEIYVMNSDGSNQTRLTYSYYDDRGPTWS